MFIDYKQVTIVEICAPNTNTQMLAQIIKKDDMKTKNTDKWTTKIINMSPTKTFWVFGLLMPIYVIWLRHVGLFTINKNGRSDKVFNILSAFLVITVFITFILGYVLLIAGQEIPDWANLIIPLSIFTIWFTCNGITGKNMVDYENRDNEYFLGLTRKKEYVLRFFHLFYFAFTIYWLQSYGNKYMGSNQDD